MASFFYNFVCESLLSMQRLPQITGEISSSFEDISVGSCLHILKEERFGWSLHKQFPIHDKIYVIWYRELDSQVKVQLAENFSSPFINVQAKEIIGVRFDHENKIDFIEVDGERATKKDLAMVQKRLQWVAAGLRIVALEQHVACRVMQSR